MGSLTASHGKGFPELLKRKNRDAFAELYDQYSGALYGIITRIVQTTKAADQLLQDVFVKAWKNVDQYEPSKGTLFSWMLEITRKTCVDFLRSSPQKIQLKNKQSQAETHPITSEIYYDIEKTELSDLAFKLEHNYRQVVDLVYFWGYSQEEVSQMLNIPLGMVNTRCNTGLEQLKNLSQQKNA